MVIGFFTDGYFPQLNGVATSVDGCAKALEALGHTVYIIAPSYPNTKDTSPHIMRIASVKYPENPEIRIATYLPGKSIVLASKINFDIIHGHTGGPLTMLGFEVAKFKRVPFVVTYHTLWNQYMHYVMKGKIITPKMTEIASRIFGNRCDTVIVPTKKVRMELLSYGIAKPIRTISNGLDLNRFRNGSPTFLREKYKVKPSTKIILFVGRLGKEKSITYLLDAYKEILRKIPDSIFMIVGNGTEEKALKDYAADLGLTKNVLFTGGVLFKDMPSIYRGADIFVFASKTETQGVVVLEAMASGVPVVTVKDDAYGEIFKEGKGGVMVSGDATEFAAEVVSLLSDAKKRKEMIDESQKIVEEHSILATAKELESLYTALIAKNKKKGSISKRISGYFSRAISK